MPSVPFRTQVERQPPWGVVRPSGLRALFPYLMGGLILDEALTRTSQSNGCEAGAVIGNTPEAAVGEYEPGDLTLMATIIRNRQGEKAEPTKAVPMLRSTTG